MTEGNADRAQRVDTTPDDTRPDKRIPVVRQESHAGGGEGADDMALLSAERLQSYQIRWEDVQAGFVDRPREAVQEAHDLVDTLVKELSESFSRQRDQLEGSWTRGDEVSSTEDLRQTLRRYRSFFNRLLKT